MRASMRALFEQHRAGVGTVAMPRAAWVRATRGPANRVRSQLRSHIRALRAGRLNVWLALVMRTTFVDSTSR
jgi:hypothetical protein